MFRMSRYKHVHCLKIYIYTSDFIADVNECDLEPGMCGNGMCVEKDNDDGYYSCDCDTGYEETGDAATLCRTCTGKHTCGKKTSLCCPTYEITHSLRVQGCMQAHVPFVNIVFQN